MSLKTKGFKNDFFWGGFGSSFVDLSEIEHLRVSIREFLVQMTSSTFTYHHAVLEIQYIVLKEQLKCN